LSVVAEASYSDRCWSDALNRLRSTLLRVLAALILPLVMVAGPAAALSAPPATMAGMAGCEGDNDQSPAAGLVCDINCPLSCAAAVATGPVAVAPLVHPAPIRFESIDVDMDGLSIRPDDPPPR
jgi:hypothetical protein